MLHWIHSPSNVCRFGYDFVNVLQALSRQLKNLSIICFSSLVSSKIAVVRNVLGVDAILKSNPYCNPYVRCHKIVGALQVEFIRMECVRSL